MRLKGRFLLKLVINHQLFLRKARIVCWGAAGTPRPVCTKSTNRNKKKSALKRKHLEHTELGESKFQTLHDINASKYTHELLKMSKEMSKSSLALRDSSSKHPLDQDSHNMKTMRPPKSPCIPQKCNQISKEKLREDLPLAINKSLNRNSSKGKGPISQKTLELQIELLKKIQTRKQ